MSAILRSIEPVRELPAFPMNRWWVAGFSWELTDKPLARTLLSRRMVLFRTPDGQVAALENRCCHKELPLSCGAVESRGLRCGYHGLLFDGQGQCVEIPGQVNIPAKAKVPSYPLREQDSILWLWVGDTGEEPTCEPPPYKVHSDPRYKYGGASYHYDAPYQLIHDNLLDLSHLGYVHVKTIGGNPKLHMNATVKTTGEGDVVKVIRLMPDSDPPPTYSAAWPFKARIDRWQEVVWFPSHCEIWTGAMDAGTADYDDPQREGFHMRGFHGVTPETEDTAHYFWTIATNPHPDKQDVTQLVVDQTAATFEEDKIIIEEQWNNQKAFPERRQIDIHVDVGPNKARRVIERLRQQSVGPV